MSNTLMISLDTETTGIDLYHGARPFLVSCCTEDGDNITWEWEVDPLARWVQSRRSDLVEIQEMLIENDEIILQNPKFDVTALRLLFAEHGRKLYWPWDKTMDTLMAGHLLASNHPHDLTNMAIEYLGRDISKYEKKLEKIVKEARTYVKAHYPDWRIADKSLPEMPSAKEKVWKYDTWLPKVVARQGESEHGGDWWTVCEEYANVDSAVTLALWMEQQKLIKERGLWNIYLTRLKLLPVICQMEKQGITVSKTRLNELTKRYERESEKAGKTCAGIAEKYGTELDLPKSGNNKSLRTVVFDHLELPPVKWSHKTGEPSMDKATLEYWQTTLPEGDKKEFVQNLLEKRARDTALTYMEGYKRGWLPMNRYVDRYILHPSLNPTGTDTLRCSSSNPNEQNISKREGFNLRYCFGPLPGRVWYSLDAENIELRIPAYESQEPDLMDVFEHPEKPPYYGSYHLVIAELLYPKLFAKYGHKFKEKYKSTYYQWVKNGNFAILYGAQEAKADATYRVPGAYKRIRGRFRRLTKFSDTLMEQAERTGYVTTIPDKSVDLERGYPILCARGEYGRIKPTTPLNYHVQSTACWWMAKAMIRCQPILQEWTRQGPREYYMIMQIHDELVFDFPDDKRNKPKIRMIKRTMEKGGEDIGVPTPVGVSLHTQTWDKEERVEL